MPSSTLILPTGLVLSTPLFLHYGIHHPDALHFLAKGATTFTVSYLVNTVAFHCVGREAPYTLNEYKKYGRAILSNGVGAFFSFILGHAMGAFKNDSFPYGYLDRLQTRELWKEMAILMVSTELGFYLYHRAAHKFAWLKPYHRDHHDAAIQTKMNSIQGVDGFDTGITDATLEFVCTLNTFTWMTTIHSSTLCTWIAFVLIPLVTYQHSGSLPFHTSQLCIQSPHDHKIHHMKNKMSRHNFGLLTVFFDKLFGTYESGTNDIPATI